MNIYGMKNYGDIQRKQRIAKKLLKKIFKAKDANLRQLYQAAHMRLCNRIIKASERISQGINKDIDRSWGSNS